MKKIRIILLFVIAAFAGTGCYSDIEADLNILERRISALEEKCDKMNTSISSLQQIVKKISEYDFVTAVKPIYDNGGIAGYTISFSHSNDITVYNGKDADTPIIGVKQANDGIYYWTVKYPDGQEDFIYNNYGQKVAATAVSPQIKIVDGDWMVTYDNGEIWHNLGTSIGESGVSFFKSVLDSGSFFIFNFVDGTSVKLPSWDSFVKVKEAAETAKKNYEALAELVTKLSKNIFARDIVPIVNGKDTIGYTLSLSDGSKLSFYNAVPTNIPELGVKKGDDDMYYWTIRYPDDTASTWILDNNEKVRANALEGVTPEIGFEKDTTDGLFYWTVSYDEGETFNWIMDGEKRILASASGNGSAVEAISYKNNSICMTIGGEEIYVPMHKTFTVIGFETDITMEEEEYYSTEYLINDADSLFDIAAFASDGFTATIHKKTYSSGTLSIKAPETFDENTTSSKVVVVISDGRGYLNNIFINVNYKTAEI